MLLEITKTRLTGSDSRLAGVEPRFPLLQRLFSFIRIGLCAQKQSCLWASDGSQARTSAILDAAVGGALVQPSDNQAAHRSCHVQCIWNNKAVSILTNLNQRDEGELRNGEKRQQNVSVSIE